MNEYVAYAIRAAITLAIGSLATVLALAIRKMKNKHSKDKAIENGMQALLRGQIIQSYNRCKDKGYCPIYELENVESLNKEYKILGGNGAIKKLVEELRNMPRD